MKKVLTGLFFLCSVTPLFAEGLPAGNLSLSLYQNNFAFVEEVRSMKLPRGEGAFRLKGLPSTLLPESLSVYGDGLQVTEQVFHQNLFSKQSVLTRHLGEEVFFRDRKTGKKMKEKGILLSAEGEGVYRIGNEVFFQPPGDVILPSNPCQLTSGSYVNIKYFNKLNAYNPVYVRYLARFLSWKAGLSLSLPDREEGNALLQVKAHIMNGSGVSFRNAEVSFIEGDAPLRQSGQNMSVQGGVMARSSFKQMNPLREGDFHRYKPGHRLNLRNNEMLTVPLSEPVSLPYRKEYSLSLYANVYQSPAGEGSRFIASSVKGMVELTNTSAYPLPHGKVYVYGEGEGGLFYGETSIKTIAAGEVFTLPLGTVSDVVAKQKMTDYKEIGTGVKEFAYELRLRNYRNERMNVRVQVNLNRQGKLIDSSLPVEKEELSRVEFLLSVPAEGKTSLMYRVQVSK